METQGSGYVVVYIRAKYFYSRKSLSDGKDRSLSAKVWNSGTTFLNSLSNTMHGFIKFTCVQKLNTTNLSGACSLSNGTQANLLANV